MLGVVGGSLALFVLSVALVWTLRNAISIGLEDLDASLVKSPVLGPIYERFFRKETYYRHDTRLLYHEIVSGVVKQKVEEVTAAKGVKLIRAHECSPILGDLYKPVTVQF